MEETSPRTHDRFERLRNALLSTVETPDNSNNHANVEEELDAEPHESSPLLRVLRNSKQDGSYRSLPSDGSSSALREQSNAFRPTVYAEKTLRALLHGILAYVWSAVIGLGVIALKFEGIIGEHISWWAVFVPFWVGNIMIVLAHVSAIQSTKKLGRWALADTATNEPLLPLYRRILVIFLVTIPLTLLLLWSELAFCARLNNKQATSLYVCYAPLVLIEVAFVVRYMLCKARSHWPGLAWILAFIFTILLAYQTNRRWRGHYLLRTADHGIERHEYFKYNMSWWMVLAPLFGFDLVMIGCLIVVLFHVMRGHYQFAQWQIIALMLYITGLGCTMSGQVMLSEHVEYDRETFTFPSVMIFAGLLLASIALYIVSKHYVDRLMVTRGGAIPVPLQRTEHGWAPTNLGVDRWLLLGEVELTAAGRAYRNQRVRYRGMSEVETDSNRNSFWSCCGCCDTTQHVDETFSGVVDPERRLQHTLRRTTSGSYDEIEPDDN